MKSLTRVLVVLAALVMVAASCGGDDGSIEVEDARYRIARADLGAGYMTVTNSTSEDVVLQGATADGVGSIELHESLTGDDGSMSMIERTDGFAIAAGQTITLQPGGLHLMIFDPEGTDDLTITLDFGDDQIDVVAAYDAEASASATGAMDDMDHGDMDDMDDMDDGAMDDDAMADG